jgi:hypothetical protein
MAVSGKLGSTGHIFSYDTILKVDHDCFIAFFLEETSSKNGQYNKHGTAIRSAVFGVTRLPANTGHFRHRWALIRYLVISLPLVMIVSQRSLVSLSIWIVSNE